MGLENEWYPPKNVGFGLKNDAFWDGVWRIHETKGGAPSFESWRHLLGSGRGQPTALSTTPQGTRIQWAVISIRTKTN